LIETDGLGKRFDSLTAVADVTFKVERGTILVLLGPNGAGKTTTVRMLAALLRPTSGTAWVAGFNITLLAQFDMAQAARRRIGEYSKGMQQKLAIIRAMLHDPPVLMLDEPTSAMDPQSAKTVRDAIRQLRDDHRTVLVCTHNLAEAEILADRIAIIRRGRIIADGSPASLKRELLGDPLMEVCLAQPIDGRQLDLNGMVSLQASGKDWFRYRTADPHTANPQVLQRLAALGLDVVTLSEVPQSLEEVYLRVVMQP
jgi:ABC-2 type transport system ATP-binding protein